MEALKLTFMMMWPPILTVACYQVAKWLVDAGF